MKTLLKLANGRGTLPIIGDCIRFDGSHAHATDLDVWAVVPIAGQFPEPRLVSAALVKSALALSRVPVWAGDTLNGIQLTAHTEHADADYPRMPASVTALDPLTWNTPLADGLARVLPAMAVLDIQYYLNGVYAAPEGHLVTTDGHRLHVAYNATAPRLAGAIVPRALFDICKKPAGLRLSATHAQMTAPGGATYTARLVEGKFPDYARVTPDSAQRPICVDVTQARIDAVTACAAFYRGNRAASNPVVLGADGVLRDKSGTLCFPFCDSLPAPAGFEVAYLLDAIKAAGVGAVMCFSTGPADKYGNLADSLLIARPDFAAVVMPTRI